MGSENINKTRKLFWNETTLPLSLSWGENETTNKTNKIFQI